MSDAPEWHTTFYDGHDPGTGEPWGIVERRRLIAAVPCIGCRLRDTDPDKAISETWEVWENGERVEDDVAGCYCDRQATAGCTPWRDTSYGSLSGCTRCNGRAVLGRTQGKDVPCPRCRDNPGWEPDPAHP